MISAFGVDHGGIAKSWTKLAPKVARALLHDSRSQWRSNGELVRLPRELRMDSRLRENSLEARQVAGRTGKALSRNVASGKPIEHFPSSVANAREWKTSAHGQYAALSRNGRKFRRLP